MALRKCEVKQNSKDLGRTKLALKTDIQFGIANLLLPFYFGWRFTDEIYKERAD